MKPLKFNELNPHLFYVPILGKNNFITVLRKYNEVYGNWYLSNSQNITKFVKLFDLLPKYLSNGFIYEHQLHKMHIDSFTNYITYKFQTSDNCLFI